MLRALVLVPVSVLSAALFQECGAQDAYDCAYDPARTHMSRTVAADSISGPVYGQVLNSHLNRPQSRSAGLKDHEIVLTFDDGPLPPYTTHVLDVLDKHCIKANFFSVGRMALASPKTIQDVERRGHTVGTHTWSHPRAMDRMQVPDAKLEIEKGFAAVSRALGKPIAPFFRFPGLRDSPETVAYMGQRNISIWSVDVISGDTEPGANPEKLRRDTLTRIRQLGRGIILFHDIKKVTSESIDDILTALEQDGFKFVQVVSNTAYQPDPELMANANAFRTAPEAATITGQYIASAKEQLKDGGVDVMHTEWIDLKQASDELIATRAGIQTPTAARPAGLKQPQITQYSAVGWAINGPLR